MISIIFFRKRFIAFERSDMFEDKLSCFLDVERGNGNEEEPQISTRNTLETLKPASTAKMFSEM